jgi:hypothetical protein
MIPHPGPSVHRYVVPQGAAAPPLPWLEHVGWTTWRDKQLEAIHTVSSLRTMVALPKPVSKWQACHDLMDEDCLYLIGSRIHARGIKMLEDANAWLGNSEIRSAITAGWVYNSICIHSNHSMIP